MAAIGTFLLNYLKDLQSYMISSFKNISIFDEEKYRDYDKNPFHMLGSMTYLFWMITVASGILLVFWYIPTPEQAYSSILHIQNDVPFGWLIRGFHKYGADALIVAITMRIYRIYFNAEYKKSFMVWVFAILSLVLAMYSGLTGYLLIWNQRAFWATKVFATFPTYLDALPIVSLTNFGKNISHILLGGKHLRGPKSALIPNQQITGQSRIHGQHQTQNSKHPHHETLFILCIKINAIDSHGNRHNQGIRTVLMKTANQPTKGHIILYMQN
jgi:quinol-cytochrome oxidoreductase complex cytochrome b subunit